MSAKRFRAKHSPGASDAETPATRPLAGRRARRVGVRSVLMFFLPTPLLLAALTSVGGDALRMTGLLAAYALLMLGAWMLREGLRAEDAYTDRARAQPPAIPRKIIAALLAGAGVAFASWLAPSAGLSALVNAVLFGILATAAHLAAFGIDPVRAKGETAEIGKTELARVIDAIDKADAKLARIDEIVSTLRDHEISERVTELNATVRAMIRLVEDDPRDLGRARRYLGVYLQGAHDATEKYAETHARLNDPEIRRTYIALLDELSESFERGKSLLLLDDRMDLEVEIEVLRDRLAQEIAR